MKNKILCLLVTTLCLVGTVSPVIAGNIPFDVTVGGIADDCKSPRAIKDSDGDMYAYYRATSVSTSENSVYVKSHCIQNASIISASAVELKKTNIGQTKKAVYNTYAPGRYEYYMKAEPKYSNKKINVTGYYCP